MLWTGQAPVDQAHAVASKHYYLPVQKCSKGIRFIFIYLPLASVGRKQWSHINKTIISDVRNCKGFGNCSVLVHIGLEQNRLRMHQTNEYSCHSASRAVRRGDSWNQKSLMEQRRHQWYKDETVCSAWSQVTRLCTINKTIPECPLLNRQSSHKHQRGIPMQW